MSTSQWVIAIAVAYLVLAVVVAFVTGGWALLTLPLFAFHFAFESVRRSPSWRLARTVKSLRATFAERQPTIVETRTMEWGADGPTVYLVCSADADQPTLQIQLADIRLLIEQAAPQFRVPPDYLGKMRLWAVSLPAVNREGGWWGFDHNVPYPTSTASNSARSREA